MTPAKVVGMDVAHAGKPIMTIGDGDGPAKTGTTGLVIIDDFGVIAGTGDLTATGDLTVTADLTVTVTGDIAGTWTDVTPGVDVTHGVDVVRMTGGETKPGVAVRVLALVVHCNNYICGVERRWITSVFFKLDAAFLAGEFRVLSFAEAILETATQHHNHGHAIPVALKTPACETFLA